jgi:hypothetical protein
MHVLIKALLRALPLLALAGGAAYASPAAEDSAAAPTLTAPAPAQHAAGSGCANCAGADCAHCPMAQAMAENENSATKETARMDCSGAH